MSLQVIRNLYLFNYLSVINKNIYAFTANIGNKNNINY